MIQVFMSFDISLKSVRLEGIITSNKCLASFFSLQNFSRRSCCTWCQVKATKSEHEIKLIPSPGQADIKHTRNYFCTYGAH